MARRLSFLTPSRAMAAASVAALAVSGGLALAATSSSPVMRACANKKTGALRLAKKCRKSERAVSWSQTGPQGARGLAGANGAAGSSGANGAAGAKGEQGPRGPGARSFEFTLPKPSPKTPLLTLEDGLTIEANCLSSEVQIFVSRTPTEANVQATGTEFSGSTLLPVHTNLNGSDVGAAGPTDANINIVARAFIAGAKFERIDLQGSLGTPCTYYGMITPAG